MKEKRKYETSHPWLRFIFDTRGIDPETWMLFGEAQSKCQHISGVPLRPSTAKELHSIYLAKGVQATTAIEGNTLSEADIRKQIEGELELPPSKAYLGRETGNILEACRTISEQALKGELPPLDSAWIRACNRSVLEGLDSDEHVIPGEYTRALVGVPGYRGAPPSDIALLMDRLCAWINGPEFADETGRFPIVHGLFKAVMAHLYLAWIHPFGDGNGRTARLVEFRLLLESGTPTPAAHLLSNHYNLTRSNYYAVLRRASSRAEGDYLPLLHYAVRGFVDGLKEQLEVIREQQMDVTWRNYVHEFMRRHEEKKAFKRRKTLVLDVSTQPRPVGLAEMQFMTPAVAAAYKKLQPRTVRRDVEWLVDAGLLIHADGGYTANKQTILAYMPGKVRG